MGVRFGERLENYVNNRGWQVMNGQSLKVGYPIHYNGSIQLNKKGILVQLNYFK